MFFEHKKRFAVLFLILCFFGVSAQNAKDEKLPEEKVILTTDRTIYFAGEQIWLKVSCIHTTQADSLSRVIYVELLDKKAKPIIQKKLQVINGISSAVMDIQEDILSGNYYMRAYTQYMRNFDKQLFYTNELTIINPDLPAKEGMQTIVKDAAGTHEEPKNGAPEISILSTSLLTNSLIEVELTGKEQEDITVSIVKKGSYESASVGVNKYYKNSPAGESEKKLKWYPEIRSVSISGKVLDKQSGKPLNNMLVYASIVDSAKQFHVTKTNSDGAFAFVLMNLHNNHQVYIGTEAEATLLVNPDFAAGLPAADYRTFKVDDTKRTLMNELYTNAQVTSVYKQETPVMQTYLDTLPDPFRSSEEIIYFKDYVALPTMTDMFNEIIPYTKVKIRKEGSRIQLANRTDKVFFENTLILLDNIPFHDHVTLLNLPPSKIKSVSVIPNRYVYGDEILNGVINIKSKDGNLAGLQLPKDISVVEYITYNPDVKASFDKPAAFSPNKPGFKNTLYWNPNVNLKEGKQKIQFYTGDEISDYDIVVRSIDTKGEVATKIKTFSVVKANK